MPAQSGFHIEVYTYSKGESKEDYMKKRVLSLLMALVLCFSMLPTVALAAGDNDTKKTELTIEEATVTATTRAYVRGDTSVKIAAMSFLQNDGSSLSLTAGTDFDATGEMADDTAGKKEVTVTVELKGDAAKNYRLKQKTAKTSVNISKANYSTTLEVNIFAQSNTEGMVDLTNLIAEGGQPAVNSTTDTKNILVDNSVSLMDNTLKFKFKQDTQDKQTATVKVKVTNATNYNDYTITVTLTVTKKTPQKQLRFTNKNMTTVTYGQTLQLDLTGGSGGGAVTYKTSDDNIATVDESGLFTAKKAGLVRIVATKTGKQEYEEAKAILDIRVTKALLTIQVLDRQISVGETAPDLSNPQKDTDYTVTGLVEAKDLKGKATMKYQQNGQDVGKPDTSKPGDYDITLTGLYTYTEVGQNGKHDNYDLKIIPGKLTILARSGGGSSSGGGGGGAAPAPTPAGSDVVTVKNDKGNVVTTTKATVSNTKNETSRNEQGQTVSKITGTVSKETAEKLVAQAVSNRSDIIEITVSSAAASSEAAATAKSTELEIPKTTVASIAKGTDASLVVKTDSGSVTLDNKTLETITSETNGDTVKLIVKENAALTEAQQAASAIGENGKLFDLAAQIGNRLLHDFQGGKAYVTLPMPQKLKGKEILVVYIDDSGLCKVLNHSQEKVGADDYIRFTTTHFSTFAIVEKAEAEKLIAAQNADHIKALMQNAQCKVTTSKTSKKSVKIQVAAKNDKTLLTDIKNMGYTVKYQFYRSTKKTAGYKLRKTSSKNSFISTKGTKGRKYYYKARVLVYDGSELVARSALKQCRYGARTWTK